MRATWQSHVRAEPRSGSKRCQSRSARSNVSRGEVLGGEAVAGEPGEVAVDVVEVPFGGLGEAHVVIRRCTRDRVTPDLARCTTVSFGPSCRRRERLAVAFGDRARVQRAQRASIALASGPSSFGPGVSRYAGEPLERRVREEHADALAHLALEHVRVPVAVRAERRRAVVDVQRAQPVEADRRVHLGDDRVERGAVGHVVAGGVQVARVEADAEPLVAVERVDELRELVDRAADRAAGAGRVLDQQPRVALAALRGSSSARCTTRFMRGVEPAAEVRADVEDRRRRPRSRPRCPPSRTSPSPTCRRSSSVGRAEVAEVERVADDAADPGLGAPRLEALDRLGLVRGGLHMRGLCVNTCTQSAPIASARSIAVSIPPAAETCAPNCIGRPAGGACP